MGGISEGDEFTFEVPKANQKIGKAVWLTEITIHHTC